MSMTYDPAGLDKLFAAINQYCEDSISLEIYAQLATNKNLLVTAEGLRRVAYCSGIGRWPRPAIQAARRGPE